MNRHDLHVLHWNANGIKNKQTEFQHFMQKHKIDIALINETHLKPNVTINIPNYYTYKTDRETTKGGGTAVLIKTQIKHTQVHTHKKLKHLETTGIQITHNNAKIKLNAVYNSPSHVLLETDLDILLHNPIPTLAAGDLNAKHGDWGSRNTNTDGKTLQRYCENRHYTVAAPTEPTRYSQHGGEILDIAVVKNINTNYTIQVLDELSSDHLPVIITLHGNADTHPNTRRQINWDTYKNTLDTPIRQLNSTDELEHAVEHLERQIQTALDTATKTILVPHKDTQLPGDILELIKQKNRARKRYHTTLDPLDKTALNNLNNQIQDKIHEHRNTTWTRKIESLNEDQTDTQALWKLAKNLRQRKQNSISLKHGNNMTTCNTETAEVFAQNLETQFTPNEDKKRTRTQRITKTNHEILNIIPDTYTFDHVTPEEIANIIQSLRTRKAPGHDNINNIALKNLPPKTILYITNIANTIQRLRHFPSRWKHAHVIMIHKPGKPTNIPESFRPISLLPALSKVIERTILSRINDILTENHIIPDEQHGFRPGHSTIHQLSRVVEFATDGLNKSFATGAVFLDVSKAFDKVWHEGLTYKLHNFHFPVGIIRLIRSYLTDRTFQVRIKDETSETHPIKAGVPQGSVIGPTLYNIYTADIPIRKDTLTAIYADDTAILSKSCSVSAISSRLQTHLNFIHRWSLDWRIKINPDKTQAIVFTDKIQNHKPETQLSLDGTKIPWTNTVKYLGMTLDSKLKFTQHISQARKKANQISGYLYPLMNKNSPLDKSNKLLIYTSIIRPTMTYAAPIWHNANPTLIHKLTAKQNITLRQIHRAPWYATNQQLHKDTNIATLTEHIHALATNFHTNTKLHANPTIKHSSNYTISNRKRKRPSTLT